MFQFTYVLMLAENFMQFILSKYNPCLITLTHLFKLENASLMQF